MKKIAKSCLETMLRVCCEFVIGTFFCVFTTARQVFRRTGKCAAVSAQATAQILGYVSKMDERLKRTEEEREMMEDELFSAVLPFKSDDTLCSFLRDSKKSLRLGLYLCGNVNWALHWGKDIIRIMFTPEYVREHYWPPAV